MATYFFDTSALVKRYVDEPGSSWVRQICDAAAEIEDSQDSLIIGSITVVEIASALSILERRNAIRRRTAQHTYDRFFLHYENEYQVTDITRELIVDAGSLAFRYPLKANDALQLALVLYVKQLLPSDEIELIFVSGDDQLLRAAQQEGLATKNPFDHAALDNPTP